MIFGRICLNAVDRDFGCFVGGEFLAYRIRELVAEGEKPVVVRSVCREVKHVLSHRVIYANFYEGDSARRVGFFR